MKPVGKILAYTALGIVIAIGGGLTYLKMALPDVGPPPQLKVTVSPERVRRGEYLANHVSVCMDCHSTRDFRKFSGPMVEGTLGKGGAVFGEDEGFPGTFYASNITPTALKNWTDGEIFRAITTGVSKDGHALFPVMPYSYYGRMDPEDVYDIIAYLRSIPAQENAVPESKADFPFNFILNTIPEPATPQQRPGESDEVAYGAYLVNAAGCKECHTREENGQVIETEAFAGGREFASDIGVLVSANLTPDPETGLGRWTRQDFIARFKSFADSTYELRSLKHGDFQTIMPWTMYGGMAEKDLGAMYAYLQTLKPVLRVTQRFIPY
ncbi:cytochrome C [Siphonobacter sp. BAB-5405]|uniref:c-type cytochrome n=1 Tax=Siphonobacter sp. BAB-5405 TaxID=1864825 RepID=UPI000C80765A|nr:c-type cytochrome [Siphonobacter sp. BAB-5405]PMD93253.1 cytochrome C [Siphonobacter sp. BAB-5405]